MDDLVDLKWLENELKKSSFYDLSRVLSVDITSAVSDGDNYASTLLRLYLKVLSKEGEEKYISMILKRNLDLTKFDSKDGTISSTLDEAYSREYNFYINIFPKLETFFNNNEKIRPECIGGINCKDLFFEDLKESGYRIANRLVGLDPNHCDLVFRSFGKLHAASYIAIERGLIDVEQFKKYPIIDSTTGQKSRKSSAYEFVADVILRDWGPEWKEIGEKLDKLKTTIRSKVEKVGFINSSSINVINHGDPWVNNFMFKYDSNGNPKKLKFLDFQMPHYNSFAFDLSYFLNTSVTGEDKQKYFETWIKSYCESFKNILDSHNCKLPCPTPDLVKAELSRIIPFSLNVCVRIRPIIMCKPEDSLPLSELVKDNGLTEAKRKIYANKNLADVLKIDLPLLINLIEP